ncbi:hypothetical protein VKT23_007521 [Stygiomarasmius scandens]|uniref:Uncharacterized protein n=1 Tax=Marasmiellus scandens TaxID=2682957 RepID=A0ABR1JK33_9AGAR
MSHFSGFFLLSNVRRSRTELNKIGLLGTTRIQIIDCTLYILPLTSFCRPRHAPECFSPSRTLPFIRKSPYYARHCVFLLSAKTSTLAYPIILVSYSAWTSILVVPSFAFKTALYSFRLQKPSRSFTFFFSLLSVALLAHRSFHHVSCICIALFVVVPTLTKPSSRPPPISTYTYTRARDNPERLSLHLHFLLLFLLLLFFVVSVGIHIHNIPYPYPYPYTHPSLYIHTVHGIISILYLVSLPLVSLRLRRAFQK